MSTLTGFFSDILMMSISWTLNSKKKIKKVDLYEMSLNVKDNVGLTHVHEPYVKFLKENYFISIYLMQF